MYVPAHFQPTDDQVRALLERPGAVDLITVTARGLLATMLPMAWDAPGSRPDLGEHGALVGHVAIKNDQWREPTIGEAMAIVGVELLIDRIDAKAKLSQNRSNADLDGVVAGLDADGRRAMSDAIRADRAR